MPRRLHHPSQDEPLRWKFHYSALLGSVFRSELKANRGETNSVNLRRQPRHLRISVRLQFGKAYSLLLALDADEGVFSATCAADPSLRQ